MKTQTNVEIPKSDLRSEATQLPEITRDHSEIERVEWLAAVTHDEFKDALTMCSVSMMDTGKAGAFAIYKDTEGTTISNPVLPEPDGVCHFGQDITHNWGIDTGTSELIDPASSQYHKLFTKFDEYSEAQMPRTDVCGCVVGFPMGEFTNRGFKAQDIRRPTKAWLEFFVQQENLHPGFVMGILTNDGKRSGLILFKKSEEARQINERSWGCMGDGDGVGRDCVLRLMNTGGIVYSDVNLSCPKNCDPTRLYEKRVKQAVQDIF